MAETSLAKFQPSKSLIFTKLSTAESKVETQKTTKKYDSSNKLNIIDYMSDT